MPSCFSFKNFPKLNPVKFIVPLYVASFFNGSFIFMFDEILPKAVVTVLFVLKLLVVPLKFPLNKIVPKAERLGDCTFFKDGIIALKSLWFVLIFPLLKPIKVLSISGKPFIVKSPDIVVPLFFSLANNLLNLKLDTVP